MIPKDLEGYAKDLEKYRINDVASKMVGVNRTLIDYRHKEQVFSFTLYLCLLQ